MGMVWRTVLAVGLLAGFVGLRSCIAYRSVAVIRMETPGEFTARFNEWLKQANAPIQAGHDRAIATIGELSEGEEWGCEWKMDHREVNAAARKALKDTDLLGAELKKHWLAVLDSATKAGTVYGIGTLVVMGRYDANCWGTDVQAFIASEESAGDETAGDGILKASWTLEPMCAGYALPGTIQIDLQGKESGKLELVATRFVGE